MSGDLHVLQVTYSTALDEHPEVKNGFRRTNVATQDIFDLLLLETTLDDQPSTPTWSERLKEKWTHASTDPVVPSSAKRNWMTCSGSRRIFLQISATLAKTERFVPSRCMLGGGMACFLRAPAPSEGCDSCSRPKKRPSSSTYW